MSQHKGLTAPQNKFLETIVSQSDDKHSAFVLGNAHSQQFPIVYCSDGFLLLTRYPRSNVMSRSSVCHFLWGPTTSAKERSKIIHTFRHKTELNLELTLYKRTGEPFRCELNVTPIKNERGVVVLFHCVYKHLQSSKWPMSHSVLPLIHSFTQLNNLHTMNSSLRLLDSQSESQYAIHFDSGYSPTRDSIGGSVHVASNPPKGFSRRGGTELRTSCVQQNSVPTKQTKTCMQGGSLATLSLGNKALGGLSRSVCQMKRSKSQVASYPTEQLQITSGNQIGWNIRVPTLSVAGFQLFRLQKRRSSSTYSTKSVPSLVAHRESDFQHSQCASSSSIPPHAQRKKFESNLNEEDKFASMEPLDEYLQLNELSASSDFMLRCDMAHESSLKRIGSLSVQTFQQTNGNLLSALEQETPNHSLRIPTTSPKQPNKTQTKCTHNVKADALNFDYGSMCLSSTCELNGVLKKNMHQIDSFSNAKFSIPNQPPSESEPGQSCLRWKTGVRLHSPQCSDSSEKEVPDPSKYCYERRKTMAFLQSIPPKKKKRNNAQKINQQLKNFSGKSVPEYKMQQFTKPNSVLLHYGLFRIVWDWVLLLLTFYIAFMVPYNVTFGRPDGHIDFRKHVIDLIVEAMMIIDVILNFNTTYVNKNGQLVYNRRQLAKHYIKGWFLLDGIAALPVDFVLFSVEAGISSRLGSGTVVNATNEGNLPTRNETKLASIGYAREEVLSTLCKKSISLLQMMKLVRLLRLARLFENFSRLSQHSLVVLGLLMFTFTLVAHWFACIWHVIGMKEGESEAGWINELAHRLNVSEQLTVETKYFTALYFTCSSLTSVGFGNVSANTVGEKIFAICIMLLGALMHAAVFGNVTAIIQRIYARRTAFQSRTQDLKDFVRVHRIPKPLKHRMEDFFQTMWAINRGIDTNEILSIYPEELRRDIALQLNRELLSLKVFKNASQDCLKSLAMQIKTTFFTPGELLIHSGDVLKRLYFVCSGSLEILDKGEVVALLGKNDWFGTYINTTTPPGETIRSRCDVKSLTYCDLQSIDLITLNQVLDQYPKFKSEFIAYLCEDLSFNIQEGAENDLPQDAIVIPAITLPPTSNVIINNDPAQRSNVMLNSINCQNHNSSIKSLYDPGSNRSHLSPYWQPYADEALSDTSSNTMRYYPRRPQESQKCITSKHKFRRATLGTIFSARDLVVRKRLKTDLKNSKQLETDHMSQIPVRSNPTSVRRHTLPVLKITMADEDSSPPDHNSPVSNRGNPPFDLLSDAPLYSDSSMTTSEHSCGSLNESDVLLKDKPNLRKKKSLLGYQKKVSLAQRSVTNNLQQHLTGSLPAVSNSEHHCYSSGEVVEMNEDDADSTLKHWSPKERELDKNELTQSQGTTKDVSKQLQRLTDRLDHLEQYISYILSHVGSKNEPN